MEQTAGGDSTAGGTVQPLWDPTKATTSQSAAAPISTAALLTTTAPRPRGEVFGFAFGNASLADPTYGYPAWSMNLLTTIAYFGLTIDWNGTIEQGGSGWTTWNSSQLTGLVSTAHANGVRVILSINLHDFSASPTSTMCAALYPTRRATTVAATAAQVAKMGVDGVNIDYEGTNATCSYGFTLQSAMTALVKEMRAKLPKAYIAVDTYSGSASTSSGFFNIPAMAPYTNSFFVMAYDMEYSNWQYTPLSCSSFCLGPTSPLTTYHYNDSKSMAQYVAVVPASKVILGVPYYGRKECVAGVTPTTAPANAKPANGTQADGYLDASTENGYSLNSNYHAHREVHDVAGYERWDTWYSSAAKCTREMYWDDVASLGRKYDLVNKLGIRGVGIFALQYGGGAPELWQELHPGDPAPSPALMPASVPAAGASISTVTLSVSISISGSPFATVSPSERIQRRILPVSWETPSAGMITSVGNDRPLPVQVRLGLAHPGQVAADRVVAAARDEELLGGEAGDHLGAVLRDDELLLDPRRRPAVRRRPERLEREDHPLLDRLGMVERDEPAEDRLLPDREPDAVPVLERERGLLVGEAELLRLRERRDDVGGRDARADHRDRVVEDVAGALVRVDLVPRRRPDRERAVVARAVAVVGVEDVEVSRVARSQHAVGEHVRVR